MAESGVLKIKAHIKKKTKISGINSEIWDFCSIYCSNYYEKKLFFHPQDIGDLYVCFFCSPFFFTPAMTQPGKSVTITYLIWHFYNKNSTENRKKTGESFFIYTPHEDYTNKLEISIQNVIVVSEKCNFTNTMFRVEKKVVCA